MVPHYKSSRSKRRIRRSWRRNTRKTRRVWTYPTIRSYIPTKSTTNWSCRRT